MDRRDEPTWVAVELTPLGEAKVEDLTLEASLRQDLNSEPDHPIFIPARIYQKGHRTVVVYLMQGYVFVAAGLPDTSYFDLERKPYVNKVMSALSGPHRIRTLSVIPNERIEDLRMKLREQVSSDIKIGDWVTIVDGPYKALEGRVVGSGEENSFVEIRLRSLNLIATIPFVFLESTEEPSRGEENE
jgi:transcription antitermination factor NusG